MSFAKQSEAKKISILGRGEDVAEHFEFIKQEVTNWL